MYDPDEWELYEEDEEENRLREEWMPLVPAEEPVRRRRRRGRSSQLGVLDELATRRLLAEEVYRVPHAWLDEVLRVRLADLEREGRRP
jgi:hypothetical protein